MKKLLIIATVVLLLLPVSALSMGWFNQVPDDPTEPPVVSENAPLIMVHGWFGSARNWSQLKAYLKDNGYTDDDLYALSMPDVFNLCSRTNMMHIEDEILRIMDITGKSKVDVIGHSRGGSELFSLMHFSNGSMVEDWISLGGFNKGCLSLYEPLPEDETPWDALYTSFYGSPTDGLVPEDVAIIDGANNVIVEVNHITMPMTPSLFPLILDALQGSGNNN